MSSETGDDTALRDEHQVSDPDDFNRSQRFREIHQARQRVSAYIKKISIPEDGGSHFYASESARLGYFISMYIFELEPLIHQSDLEESDYLPDGAFYDSLIEFAYQMGDFNRKAPAAPQELIIYFSAANRIYADLGMDLQLDDNTEQQTKIDDDVLEEVNQWRQENI